MTENYEGRKRTMSSFELPVCNCEHIKKTFVSPGKSLFKHICKILKLRHSVGTQKRMSFFSSLHKKKQKASMAVEASMALPLFLFFFMNILSAFHILKLHGNLMAAMHQTGNRMAFYAYAFQEAVGEDGLFTEEIDSFLLSEGYARNQVVHILGKEYLEHSPIANGVSGLHFVNSSVMGKNEVIELVASYKVKPFIPIMGFPDFAMENRYYGRAWTGYDTAGRSESMTDEDPLVYVAETGTVYHMARNCSYLNPSVEAVTLGMLPELRNESGEKYFSCARCRNSLNREIAYITQYGNKAHSSVNCAGLKRTVFLVHLSEVGDKGKCSKCGTEQQGD